MKVQIERTKTETVMIETSAFKKDPSIPAYYKLKESNEFLMVLDAGDNYSIQRYKKIDDDLLDYPECTEEEFNQARNNVLKKLSEL